MAPTLSSHVPRLRRGRIARGCVRAFVCAAALAAASVSAFDGERAMASIRRQCAFGPRVPGTPEHAEARQWLAGQMRELGFAVREERFEVVLPLTGARVEAVNLWGVRAGDGPTSPVVLLSAHWDTRPFADRDPSGRRPSMLGANDGASGVAMVLELARVLGETDVAPHLAVALWDAEDAGVERDLESWALGAQYASRHAPEWIDRVALGVNLDLVAGADLRLYREEYSLRSAPWAVEEVWRLGALLAPARFVAPPAMRRVYDDHVPWTRRGVPYINLVGLPYAQWHTAADTPEHCRVETLDAVGNVVHHYLLRGAWRRPRNR